MSCQVSLSLDPSIAHDIGKRARYPRGLQSVTIVACVLLGGTLPQYHFADAPKSSQLESTDFARLSTPWKSWIEVFFSLRLISVFYPDFLTATDARRFQRSNLLMDDCLQS
jgi:hypothetical protein